jgi:UDP-N-acetylmuramate dehydrogenase
MDEYMIDEFRKMIKGSVVLNEKLARHTSFKIGGPADIWVQPADARELKNILLFARANKIHFFVIGGGSNILVKDEGVRGIVINLGSPFFRKIKASGTKVTVGAGCNVSGLIRSCCDAGLGGLESLIGIPGTVGGAVYMNAGGSTNPIYKNIGDFVTEVKVMDHEGNIKKIAKDKLVFGYRKSNLEKCIILEVALKLERGEKEVLNSSCRKFLSLKKQKQALDAHSAGCVFKNPGNSQFTCGQMIDMLGLKGTKMGGAEISEKHANFIVNRKGATCSDVMKLIEFIKGKVKNNYNISLDLEIKVI